jgi:hypothetical protein
MTKRNNITTADLNNRRKQRTQILLDDLAETQRVNLVGIEFLKGIIDDHPDRVYRGQKERPDSYLIVRGDLANYCIPAEPLLRSLTNPFTAYAEFPPIEVHPLGKWVRKHAAACIQPNGHSDIPGTDSIGILVAGLISDRDLFADPTQAPFRRALMRTYGMIQSPVSELFATYLESYGATIDLELGEISVKGTHGFTWHLGGMKDPEIRSFSLSSSVRGAPRRKHCEDTFDSVGDCSNLEYLLPTLSKAPRIFLGDEDSDLSGSKVILFSVAEYWAPLRRAIESGDVDLTAAWGDDE